MSDLWLPNEARHAVWVPDAEQIIVVGWRPGPAGVSSIDLTPTLRVAVDHASPTTLTEVVFAAPQGRLDEADARVAARLLGREAVSQLMTISKTWNDHPLRLTGDARARYEPGDDVRRLVRLVLGSDLADDEDGADLVRGMAGLEAGRAAVDLEPLVERSLIRRLLVEALERLRSGGLETMRRGRGGLLAGYAHDLATNLVAATGFLQMEDQIPDAWTRVLGAVDAALSTFDDLFDGGAGRWPAAAGSPMRDARATSFEVAVPAAAAAPSALRRKLASARQVTPDDAVEVDATPGPRALAWIDSGGNIQISGPRSLERSWARVFRRRGELMLGLSPLLPATTAAGVEATVVIPSGHGAADLVVDITDEPAEARPSTTRVELREAIRSGRTAAHHTRIASPEAADSWRRTAAAWRSVGDETRANVAERYADDRRPPRSDPEELQRRRRSSQAEALVADRVWDLLD